MTIRDLTLVAAICLAPISPAAAVLLLLASLL